MRTRLWERQVASPLCLVMSSSLVAVVQVYLCGNMYVWGEYLTIGTIGFHEAEVTRLTKKLYYMYSTQMPLQDLQFLYRVLSSGDNDYL